MKRQASLTTALLMGSFATTAFAVDIEVTVETTGPVGLAPLFSSFHSGNFDIFNRDASASDALETLAEVGDPASLVGTLPASANGGAVVGSPVIPPGTAASNVFDVDASNSQFSYASMILPSNDWFIGSDNSMDISQVLNGASGESMTILVDISSAYDAATEVEDFAFSAGNPLFGLPAGDAPAGTDIANGTIFFLNTAPNPFGGFQSIPEGFDTNALDFTNGSIAQITITNVSGLNGVSASLPGSVDLGGDYAFNDGFGVVYTAEYPFLYQSSLGWVYSTAGETGHYFYRSDTSSWAWSDAGVWPAYYDFGSSSWETASE